MGAISEKKTHDAVGSFYFIVPNDLHKTEKAYFLQYDPGEGLARTNMELKERHNIPIKDLRQKVNALKFEASGIAIETLNTSLQEADFNDERLIQTVYYPEVEQMLKKRFDADHVIIMEHLVRKRDAIHPISTGEDYEFFQPTAIVHSDFTDESSVEAVEKIFRLNMGDFRRITAVNVWKPLHGPVTDWPLAVCDASSVDPGKDFFPSDIVTRTGYTENTRVAYNPNHKWYYLSQQLASEVVIFRQFDTNEDCKSVPHSGFEIQNPAPGGRRRESVELRAFMFYEKDRSLI